MAAIKSSGDARASFAVRRSHHRCFGGTGGCTAICGGVGGVVGRADGDIHRALPFDRPPVCATCYYYI